MEIWFHPAKEIQKIADLAAQNYPGFDTTVRPADPRFGDFQINGALPYAKQAKANPRKIAEEFLEQLKASDNLDPSFAELSIAGPGFINIALTPKFLSAWIEKYKGADALRKGAQEFYSGKKMVIDYPSPNTAKQMHVGHLRPMVIGEAIQRLLRFCGADMICDNHIGDWGTNFGILIYGIKKENYKLAAANENALEDLERMYKAGSALAKENPQAADDARNELVKLQNGDPENTALWNEINKVSQAAFDKMYTRLGITTDVTLGESFYRDKVDRVYSELLKNNIAQEDQGALVVFFKDSERFKEQPFLVRKKDGASNYGSTDLATVLHRVEHFGAEEIIYVTDGRQQDHFQQLFMTVGKWFNAESYKLPELRHVWFGTILGEDGRAIKTKSGEPVRLKSLLDEAAARALAIVHEKTPDMPADEAATIAERVGVAALRYADLSQNRTSDYTFSWSKMLAFDGNTAPYLMYAVARIHSIFRKANIDLKSGFENGAAPIDTPQEIELARKLIALPNIFDLTLADLRPHLLCGYLFELAGLFSSFYNANKVIVEEKDIMAKRLMLCARTLEILETGLRLLGIEPLEKM